MRQRLSQQAPDILGNSALVIITERVDDVALLIGLMVQMGLPGILDRHILRHWLQRRLNWGTASARLQASLTAVSAGP